jgi:hypothetical protein
MRLIKLTIGKYYDSNGTITSEGKIFINPDHLVSFERTEYYQFKNSSGFTRTDIMKGCKLTRVSLATGIEIYAIEEPMDIAKIVDPEFYQQFLDEDRLSELGLAS